MKRDLGEAIPKFDIESYLLAKGADPGAVEWTMDCPKCTKRKLVVNVNKKTFHCWVCETAGVDAWGDRYGAGGLVALISWLEGWTFRRAADWVIDQAWYCPVDPDRIGGLVKPSTPTLRPTTEVDRPLFSTKITHQMPYLLKRRITMDDVHDFGLWWCIGGRYQNRLIFPVWEDRKLVYWQARAMWDPKPGERIVKALNPPGVDNKDKVMNLDIAKHYPRVAIVEGPIDCVRVGRDAVCVFGKNLFDAQIMKMVRAGVRAVDLMFDGPTAREPAGTWETMLEAAGRLSQFFDTKLVALPYGDPGDHDRSSLTKFRERAIPASKAIGEMNVGIT